MKTSASTLALLLCSLMLAFTACKEKTAPDPCEGQGVLNVENKLDSTISVKVVETHTTLSVKKDFTQPFILEGNQAYTLTIDGPQYHKDTTFMILDCDNKLFIVDK